MRVIFLEDVPGTADAGEVREVKNGFARNYLMPRKLAAPATPGQLQRDGPADPPGTPGNEGYLTFK